MKKIKTYKSKLIESLLDDTSAKETKLVERKMLLAARIADAMKSKGFNKTNFAEKMEKGNSVITKWLSGTHNFTTETLWDIEDALDIDLINVQDQTKIIETIIKTKTIHVPAKPINNKWEKSKTSNNIFTMDFTINSSNSFIVGDRAS